MLVRRRVLAQGPTDRMTPGRLGRQVHISCLRCTADESSMRVPKPHAALQQCAAPSPDMLLTEVGEPAPGGVCELPEVERLQIVHLHQLQHQRAAGHDACASRQEVPSHHSLQH